MGMVNTQAIKILPAMPQRTAETRLEAPTPMMAEEMTWVVETGARRIVAVKITMLPADSAAKPLIGFNLMILCPMVFIIRQPPADVPSAMAAAQATITQVGTTHS